MYAWLSFCIISSKIVKIYEKFVLSIKYVSLLSTIFTPKIRPLTSYGLLFEISVETHLELNVVPPIFGPVLKKKLACRQILVESLNITFHENPFGYSRAISCVQTDG
jgi:hypothetical protein